MAYGCRVEYINIPIEAVDTHRAKPVVPGYLDEKFRRTGLEDSVETTEPPIATPVTTPAHPVTGPA